MEQHLKPRKVVELKSRLIRAVQSRVLIANETSDTELVLDSVECVDGSKPRLLIRVKRRVLRRRK